MIAKDNFESFSFLGENYFQRKTDAKTHFMVIDEKILIEGSFTWNDLVFF